MVKHAQTIRRQIALIMELIIELSPLGFMVNLPNWIF